jgi:tetratricopeptide (TPR) repeat protein
VPAPLQLHLTDYIDGTRWRWELTDNRGGFVADHQVQMDPTTREYDGFVDVSRYLDYLQPLSPPETQLAALGSWIGQEVFGGLRAALWDRRVAPALAVRVIVPPRARDLLLRPFELARFADGTSFLEEGVRFVYQLQEPSATVTDKEAAEGSLRVLAVFSLPVRANPLNLRRERHGLQRLVRDLNQTQGLAVELRVLQYGATRDTLTDALEGEGWDVIHLSGHGSQGELALEDDQGGIDEIGAEELGELLEPARERLKLLILDACYSGAGSHAAARAQVGLDPGPDAGQAQQEVAAETAPTTLPSLAMMLSGQLDCAALAMRYPVGDAFATDLLLALYEKLLDRRSRLPAALHQALGDAMEAGTPRPPLSAATPILIGSRAADLRLDPPQRPPQRAVLPTVGLRIGFPPEPERFVGRLQPMLRASHALARRSPLRGVLFHGMPGAGKTACALELAYRHEEGRFPGGQVWYRGPEAGTEVAGELFKVLFEIQRQLDAPDLGLTAAVDEPERFRAYTLPRLRALLEEKSILVVLDNLETLLTDANRWRDPLWADLVATLLAHDGYSRVVMTSRRVPVELARHPRMVVEPIHALSLAESVLLARELPHLRTLFDDDEGLELIRQTLRVVQGHPKLLELADGLASDRAALARRVAEAAETQPDEVLDAFFAPGVDREGETRQSEADYVRVLGDWTAGVTGGLSPTARLLLAFLCRAEPDDRDQWVVQANWKDVLTRLGEGHPDAAAALARPDEGLQEAVAALEDTGLVAVDRPEPAVLANMLASLAEQAGRAEPAGDIDPAQPAGLLAELAAGATTYTIHAGVAEAVREAAEKSVLDAADVELGDFHLAGFQRGEQSEGTGGGGTVVAAARRGVPYLLRQDRWPEATLMLERMLARDSSPEALDFATPVLRVIAGATRGHEGDLIYAGVLARALQKSGRTGEAEQIMRDVLARSIAGGQYRIASSATGDLVNLLREGGRLGEALAMAEEMATYTRRAGLGPWTQLMDEAMRLQVLAAMGRYAEVLAAVKELRPKLDTLPTQGEADETVDPWNAREVLLDTGNTAALGAGRWEAALALNGETVRVTRARGADELEVAKTRFGDYAPLLRLSRYGEARALLLECRAVFEAGADIQMVGMVYSALADLEDKTGGGDEAVRFQEVALPYTYRVGQPANCGMMHHNLANYLEHRGDDASLVLGHRLAAGVVRYQTQSGGLASTLSAMALSELPPSPPTFAEVAERVEAIEGVRFTELFERLPRTAPDGDAAIAEVWRLVGEAKSRMDEERRNRDEVLASLPPVVRAAFDLEGGEFSAALEAALAELPPKEADATLQRLRDTGLLTEGSASDLEEVLREFGPLLELLVAAVKGESLRPGLEPLLANREEKGWMLREPIHRIWAGERDPETLTIGLDDQDTALIREVLRLLGG